MKKILVLSILFLSVFSFSGSAQCGEELLKAALKEMGDAQYIKDYTINLNQENKDTKTGYVKFSVILRSNSLYKFNTVNGSGNPEKVILQLYDEDRMLISNFEGGKIIDAPQFLCRKSKVYSLVFSFKGGAEGCAKAVMSLVKQYSAAEINAL
jgi:outer membrane lipoprotein-sorting protein